MSDRINLTDDRWRELTAEEYILRNTPERYGSIAGEIERLLDYDAMVPSSICQCDERRCFAHNVAHDYAMKGQPERLERFCRLVERWRKR